MQDKLRNTELNASLYWPDFFSPTTLKWSPGSLRMKLNSKKTQESFLSWPSIFWYLGKETKNTAEHVIMNKIFIYARPCVNKDFFHSCSIGVI